MATPYNALQRGVPDICSGTGVAHYAQGAIFGHVQFIPEK